MFICAEASKYFLEQRFLQMRNRHALAMMLFFNCVRVAAGESDNSSQALSLGLSPRLVVCVLLGMICFALSRSAGHVGSSFRKW